MKNNTEALKEYTLKTDVIKKVGVDKYEVTREGKVFNFETQLIIAAGDVQKLHNRLLIKTSLPKLSKITTEDEKNKIKNDLSKLNDWIEKNEKYMKGSDYFFKQKMKRERLINKLNQAD